MYQRLFIYQKLAIFDENWRRSINFRQSFVMIFFLLTSAKIAVFCPKFGQILTFLANFFIYIKTIKIHYMTNFQVNWIVFGVKMAFFSPFLGQFSLYKSIGGDLGAGRRKALHGNGDNFWTRDPMTKILGILKTRDLWLSDSI